MVVLSREEVSADSVVYEIDQWRVYKSSFYNEDTNMWENYCSQQRDTIVNAFGLVNLKRYNYHPFEAIPTSQDLFGVIGRNSENQWYKKIYNDQNNVSLSWHKHYQACLGVTKSYLHESGETKVNENMIYYNKGSEEWGEPIDFELLTKTEEVQSAKPSLKIYPNPASKSITIKNTKPNRELGHIELFNATGQKISNWQAHGQNEMTQSISHLPSGFYWLLVKESTGKIWRLSFVKN